MNDREQDVYNFIVRYKSENNGNSPSYRDIGAAMDMSSTSYVKFLLKKLQEQELVSVGAGARNISVPGYKWVRVEWDGAN